jgi:hypothetical protein
LGDAARESGARLLAESEPALQSVVRHRPTPSPDELSFSFT